MDSDMAHVRLRLAALVLVGVLVVTTTGIPASSSHQAMEYANASAQTCSVGPACPASFDCAQTCSGLVEQAAGAVEEPATVRLSSTHLELSSGSLTLNVPKPPPRVA